MKGILQILQLRKFDLIIEVDGGYHDTEEQKSLDLARELYLNQRGFTVLRFANKEVLNDIKTVLKKIEGSIKTQKRINNRKPVFPFSVRRRG